MRIGIFGGTFNPVHFGHTRAAGSVLKDACLDKIIFVPSYMPPHKGLDYNIPGGKRLEAVRLAIAGNSSFEASSFEIQAKGTSYSIRTIEYFAELYRTTPYFIIGQDAFNEIMSWYQAEKLFTVAHFIVMSRPGCSRADLKEIMGNFAQEFIKTPSGYINRFGKEISFIDVEPNAISSSNIRGLIRAGRPITGLVPEAVEKYINKERMYL